jgi:hypothetical protein
VHAVRAWLAQSGPQSNSAHFLRTRNDKNAQLEQLHLFVKLFNDSLIENLFFPFLQTLFIVYTTKRVTLA